MAIIPAEAGMMKWQVLLASALVYSHVIFKYAKLNKGAS
jgi:hypothetical protein